jgi:hypothetical protein
MPGPYRISVQGDFYLKWMALHWHIKDSVFDFKGFYIFLIAKRAEKDDFSQKSGEDRLRR